MKVDIIRKYKWYIVGFILVVIMLGVGLSFCTWDDLSINKALSQAKTGGYNAIKLNEHLTLVDDKNNNNRADVGDIVNFGRYYLDAPTESSGETIMPDKTSLRWIVVNIDNNNMATLLTESVIAFGSFWGTFCYDANNGGGWAAPEIEYHTYYQNYERSTARAWLNSYSNLRNDGGTNFSHNATGVFQGFYNIAFNANEQNYIVAQDITGMRGSIKGKGELANIDYDPIYGDKVWLPSYSQLFGTNPTFFINGDCSDGAQTPTANNKFSYFTDNAHRIGKATAFATTPAGNYTYLGKTIGTTNYQQLNTGGNAFWMLRSTDPIESPLYLSSILTISNGALSGLPTDNAQFGVRPAVSIPL